MWVQRTGQQVCAVADLRDAGGVITHFGEQLDRHLQDPFPRRFCRAGNTAAAPAGASRTVTAGRIGSAHDGTALGTPQVRGSVRCRYGLRRPHRHRGSVAGVTVGLQGHRLPCLPGIEAAAGRGPAQPASGMSPKRTRSGGSGASTTFRSAGPAAAGSPVNSGGVFICCSVKAARRASYCGCGSACTAEPPAQSVPYPPGSMSVTETPNGATSCASDSESPPVPIWRRGSRRAWGMPRFHRLSKSARCGPNLAHAESEGPPVSREGPRRG